MNGEAGSLWGLPGHGICWQLPLGLVASGPVKMRVADKHLVYSALLELPGRTGTGLQERAARPFPVAPNSCLAPSVLKAQLTW